MSRVLVGHSYFLRFDPKLWDEMRPYPPLGSLYAASILREAGHDVSLFDAMLAESVAEWKAALDTHRPDYALLYEDNFNYLSKMCLLRMREAAVEMIELAKQAGVVVLQCGADASDHPEVYFEAGSDFVLLGEGDETLHVLMEALEAGETRPETIEGLAYRGSDGTLRCTKRRAVLRDLDALPLPAWDLVNVERYRARWLERHGHYSINMVTTRGCPYHCSWCAKPIWGQRYAARSPENVALEMRSLLEVARPDHVWFMDDIMGLKPGWLARFADVVEKEDVQIPFKCLSRADLLLRPGEVEALARAGCQSVWIGAESGSQKILDAMEKGTRVEQIEQATRALRGVGIRVGYFIQFGYPGEDRDDIDETLALVRRMVPEEIGMSVSYPLPGTKFYDRVRDQLGAKQNWDDSSDLAMLYDGPYTTEFYRVLYTLLHREWYVLHHRREVASPSEWSSATPRRLAGMLVYGLSLPWLRVRLKRLEGAQHSPIAPLPPVLSREQANTPSPDSRGDPTVSSGERA